MNEFTKMLVDLINENPNLPVITMVEMEIVGDDTYGRWYSTIGLACVDEYVMYEKRHSDGINVIYKSDIEEIIEDLQEREEDLTDEQAEKMALCLDWEKAIFLNIDLPE